MAMYRLKKGESKLERLEEFEYASEGSYDFSPQRCIEATVA